jgi:hypothetical protein
MDEKLRAGVGVANITPSLGVSLRGYYHERKAEGVHDDLLAKAVWLQAGDESAVVVECDLIGMNRDVVSAARELIAKRERLPADNVMLAATHTHTGPTVQGEYAATLATRIADAVHMARLHARPARAELAYGQEPSICFYRRFRMKDGTVQTNPGHANPGVVEPAGEVDPRVGVVGLCADDGQPFALLVNYALHLDTVGGNLVSADYPFFMSEVLRRALSLDVTTVFLQGAAGNINHFDVFGRGPLRGFAETERIGTILAGEVLKCTRRLQPLNAASIRCVRREIELPVPDVTGHEVAQAREILAAPPDDTQDFTMDRVRAHRAAKLGERAGAPVQTELQCIAVGDLAIVGIPGELFAELGRAITNGAAFPHTFIVELANDSVGYLPHPEAFDEGAYEAESSILTPDVGDRVVSDALDLLHKLGK